MATIIAAIIDNDFFTWVIYRANGEEDGYLVWGYSGKPFGKSGGFDAIQQFLILRDNLTNYEVWHELSHFRQYQSLGKEAYLVLQRTKDLNSPEQFVIDMLEN